MFRRILIAVVLASTLLLIAGCRHNNVQNPIANVDSKQPDKVLFDRAMVAMKKGKYDVARMTLQTLINTYPDSEFLARAKLAVGDSWYAEGGSAAYAQAEIEYKDFITFFPNMPEAAEAQLKVADIHFRQMEKPDRDYTHAKRAEEEYKQVLLQFPDSKLVPIAKQRLLAVQEVLAEREFLIGRFYFLRAAWPAAIARLTSVTQTYPLYSKADEALYMLGQAYEGEVEIIRNTPSLPAAVKERAIAEFLKGAQDAYDKILTNYPVMARAKDARDRLEALKMPIPTATPEAIAENKKIEASRGDVGTWGKLMSNFKKGPVMAEAATVGEPTLVEPKQMSATEITVDDAQKFVREAQQGGGGGHTVSVEAVGTGAPPPSEVPPTSAPSDSGNSGIPELTPSTTSAQPEAAPAPGAGEGTQLPPPRQVNEITADSASSSTPADQKAASKDDKDNSKSYSTSKKKKKTGFRKLIPF